MIPIEKQEVKKGHYIEITVRSGTGDLYRCAARALWRRGLKAPRFKLKRFSASEDPTEAFPNFEQILVERGYFPDFRIVLASIKTAVKIGLCLNTQTPEIQRIILVTAEASAGTIASQQRRNNLMLDNFSGLPVH